MQAEPQKEHQWLQKFVGEWKSEMNASMGPENRRKLSSARIAFGRSAGSGSSAKVAAICQAAARRRPS